MKDKSYSFEIANARIVAALTEGGVVVEQHDPEYSEGRDFSFGGDDPDTPQLTFSCFFGIKDAPIPGISELARARIVIDGEYEGQTVEIRGEGHFGYTDKGTCEGHFIGPPAILFDFCPPPPEDARPDMPRDEWLAYMD